MSLQATAHRIVSAFFAIALAFSFAVVVPQHARADEPGEPAGSVSPVDPVEEAGLVRIHVMPFAYNDAIIVECDGRFGVIDSGEDSSYPDGSNARYPFRDGTIIGGGHEDEMIAYMRSIGVNQENLDFYIGTHPHSDHVGSASEIIHEFHPKAIYLPVYDDSYITEQGCLWDNQYVYDRFLEAALWAKKTYGARLIQHLDPNYTEPEKPDPGKDPDNTDPDEKDPDDSIGGGDENKDPDGGDDKTDPPEGPGSEEKPEKPGDTESPDNTGDGQDGSDTPEGEGANNGDTQKLSDTSSKTSANKPSVAPKVRAAEGNENQPEHPTDPSGDKRIGSPVFMLGSAKIEILNYDEGYQLNKVPDANYFSYGVKVTASNGRTAFLSGDINNYTNAPGDGGVGDEDRLKDAVGTVDFLKLGHHGGNGSNSENYLRKIIKQASGEDRCVAVQTGPYEILPKHVIEILAGKGARYFSSLEMPAKGENAFIAVLAADGVKTNVENETAPVVRERDDAPLATLTFNGVFYKSSGWYKAKSGRQYYFGVPGAGKDSAFALTDVWATLDGTKVYIDNKGEITRYTHNSDPDIEVPVTPGSGLRGWQKYGDDWVYYDSKGALAKGWLKTGGTWYYLRSSGIMATGWEQVGGVWYYLSSSGAMKTGWVKHEGHWFFFDGSGAMKTGWINTGGAWYYLAKSGTMLTGWQQIDGKWYYLKSSGAMATGWQLIDGAWYYLNGSGSMKTGWIKSNGIWYYLHDSGHMVTGWQMVGNTWYYMSASGAMKTGWVQSGRDWYYMGPSGAMAKGWQYTGGAWYYMNPADGIMQTGWLELDGKKYYLKSSGAMATGWQLLGSEWCYFNGSGVMQKDKWVGNYYVGSDGNMVRNQWVGKYHVNGDGYWDLTR